MCMLCIELDKKYMTPREIARAINESQIVDEDHSNTIIKKLEDYGLFPAVLDELYELDYESGYDFYDGGTFD